jgi:hypothetical protein
VAKKQTFADKLKKSEKGQTPEFIKVVRAEKTKDGAWKFRTQVMQMTDETKNELFK